MAPATNGARVRSKATNHFPPEPVAEVELNCSTGEFSYHLRDRDPVLFALNEVIYILTRQ